MLLLWHGCSGGDNESVTNSGGGSGPLVPFGFAPIANAELSTAYLSDEWVLNGLGGERNASVNNGVLMVNGSEANSSSVLVRNGDIIRIQVTTLDQFNTTVTATLTLAGIQSTFSVTTKADSVPDAFTFQDLVDVNRSTRYTSNTITVSGLGNDANTTASITGGELVINGSKVAGSSILVRNGDTVAVEATASSSYETTIEAVVTIGTVQDSFSLTTRPKATALALSQTSLYLIVGETSKLEITPTPSNADSAVTWRSGDATVATVSPDGTVTATGTGQTTVTATSLTNSSIKTSCAVSAQETAPDSNLTTLFYDDRAWILNYPDWYTSEATTIPILVTSGEGSSGEPASPVIDGPGIGYSTLSTMPSQYRFYGQDRRFDPFTFSALSGENYQIDLRVESATYTGNPYLIVIYGDDNTITSPGTDIFFNNDGGTGDSARLTLYDVPAGTHAILATTAENNASTSFQGRIIVTRIPTPTITTLSLSPASVALQSGHTKALALSVTPEGANSQVTFSSSDPEVATVSATGVVTAVSAGRATITAYSTSDLSKSASTTVTVDITEVKTLYGRYDTNGFVSDSVLTSTEGYALLTDSAGGFKVISLATLSAPTLTASMTLGSFAEGLTITDDDNITFVANGTNGLRIIQTATPAAPSLVTTYNTGYGYSTKYAWDVTLGSSEQYAFVATGAGMEILDVQSAALPVYVGEYNTTGTTYGVTLSSDNKQAFLADGSGGVAILDIRNPGAIASLATYNGCSGAKAVTLSKDDTVLYVACGTNGVMAIDVSDPAAPVLLGSYNTPGESRDLWLSDDGSTLYVADGTMGVLVLDVSDPAHPWARSAYNSAGSSAAVRLTADESYGIVSDGGNGLLILQ